MGGPAPDRRRPPERLQQTAVARRTRIRRRR